MLHPEKTSAVLQESDVLAAADKPEVVGVIAQRPMGYVSVILRNVSPVQPI